MEVAPARSGPAESTLAGSSFVVLAGSVMVGVANYGFSLALVWILAARAFAVVASVNALLIIVGTAGAAALPWFVARQVAREPVGAPARRQAISFAFTGSLVLGVVTTVVVVAVAASYAGPAVLSGLAVTTMGLFVGSTGIGYLQGAGRFRALALLEIVEVGCKVGLGTALAGAGLGPGGAVAGSALGAVVVAVVGVRLIRTELAWPRRRTHAGLWGHMAGIGGIQIGVSVLSALDVVVASVVDGATHAVGGYEALLVFARIPLFVSTAVSVVVYPRLSAGGPHGSLLRQSAALYVVLSACVMAVLFFVPSHLLALVLPHGYRGAFHLLPPLLLAGFGTGAVNLVATYLQAEGAFRWTLPVLGVGMVVLGSVEIAMAPTLVDLAWTSVAGSLGLWALLALLVGPAWLDDHRVAAS